MGHWTPTGVEPKDYDDDDDDDVINLLQFNSEVCFRLNFN